ncbi:X-Pro dipeptidyl-peptidase [Histoplasma capsulatum G186AR]|nr:X-Pro dipeptidyl-peptidase [Histoplasma capsulatum]QSS72663.1 X-Pro dipeptidyl-peptidase [Histoplasma capsulatum G186AR]
MIPYPPEELLSIGQSEYAWCEEEMIKASTELGYGRDWHRALEFVKTLHAEQGQQAQLVHDGVLEVIEFVTRQYDLVTVPPLAAKTWKMDMVSPSPEFQSAALVGGEKMVAAYPTVHMSHESKLASLRTNNIHFSHSTGFHEVIPDHHLQLYMNVRHRTYRALFYTPFWIEGGAMYWEMLFWDKKFPTTPEDKI